MTKTKGVDKKRFAFDFIYRKKNFTEDNVGETKLDRVMGLLDITAIGISSTLGSGIYVLSGQVIANYSGPSIIISFIIAGLATFFSGICYAELGARVPRSGSAYTYIYVTIGEFCAFIMGWDLILEYVLGTASVANALSQYIDVLCGRKIRETLRNAVPMNVTGLGPYPDFLAFGLAFVVSMLLIVGVKESSTANKIFTILNITVLSFIIITGATKANFANWNLHLDSNFTWSDTKNEIQSCETSPRCGKGGFMPFDFSGVIRGAAKCFYAFIGFDAIASTGEEVVNPKRNIPLSIVITLGVVSILYCFLSGVLTLMVPFYLVDPDTPLPQAFDYTQLYWARYVVTAGAVASLSTCLYAGAFPMPRVVYSMASDGLIYRFMAKVLPKLKTPFVAALVTGLFAALLATIFDLNELVDMLSIGTLMAYSLVSTCVLILRYQPDVETSEDNERVKSFFSLIGFRDDATRQKESIFKILFAPRAKDCTKLISKIVFYLAIICVACIVAICIIINSVSDLSQAYAIILLVIFGSVVIVATLIIWRQPQTKSIKTFKIPLVPFLPLISVFINVYLMMTLTLVTWARFLIWFVIGCCVYFTYGIRESNENKNKGNQYFFLPCLLKSATKKSENVDNQIVVNNIQLTVPEKQPANSEPSKFIDDLPKIHLYESNDEYRF